MSEDQKPGKERTYDAKGFDLKSEIAGYESPHYEGQAPVRQPAVAELPVQKPVVPAVAKPAVNPDDDVSIVIFGDLEEQTRKLAKGAKTVRDLKHILYSGSLPEDDMS